VPAHPVDSADYKELINYLRTKLKCPRSRLSLFRI